MSIGIVAVAAVLLALVVAALVWRPDGSARRGDLRLRDQADLLEQTYDAILIRSPGGRIEYWNRGAEALYGFPRAEALGRRSHDLLRTRPRAGSIEDMENALLRHRRWEGVLEHTCADGRQILTESRQVLVRGLDGARILEANRDVTARVTAELEARRAAEAAKDTVDGMRASDARLRRAFEIAQLGLLWADPGGTVTLSDELAAMLCAEAGPRRMTWDEFVLLAHEEDRPLLEGFRHAGVAGAVAAVEFRVCPADRRTRWVTIRGAVAPDATGAARLVGVAQDITARRESEQRLQQAGRHQAVGTLAGGMAHEVNNMMTAVIGFTSYARNALPPDHPACADLDEALHAAERAATVTQQVLAFSRQSVMQPVLLDLNEVAVELAPVLRRLAGAHTTVSLELAPELPPVRADRAQLEQMLINLVANARDAMPAGGRVRIASAARELAAATPMRGEGGELPAGRYSVLTVSDSGNGMSEETQTRAFDPFFTTKPVGAGTGLGLPMVYGIMRQSGGDVWLESEPGRGTTAMLLFPASREPVPDADRGGATHEAHGRGTVLVVDDEPLVRAIARRSLEQLGYTVREAIHGDDAIARLGSESGPDLVLCDLVMPERNGAEVGRHLALTHPEVPILYMSGYTGEEMRQRGLLPAGSAFVAKPFTPASLGRQVRWRLEHARANGNPAMTR